MKPLRLPRLDDILALLFLIVYPLVNYLPVTLGQQVFSGGDIDWLYLPQQMELGRALAQGRLPLWSPGLEAGFPLFAEGQVAALYPFNLILHLLLPTPMALSYAMLVNVIWASIGMYLLIRSSGMRASAALLGAFIFGFSGYQVSHLIHVPLLAVASWLPWLIVFQKQYWQAYSHGKRAIGWFIAICFAIAFEMVAGFPQIAFYNLAIYVAFGLIGFHLWEPQESTGAQARFRMILHRLPRAVLVTGGSVALGMGLAALQLIPAYELVNLSIRGRDLGTEFFASYSLDPSALLQLVAPYSFMWIPNSLNMEFWGYVGVLPALLAITAIWLRRDARTITLALVAMVAFLLALGYNTPLYNLLYYVPVFNRFRVPARFLLLFTFAMAYLAAIALEELGNRRALAQNRWVERAALVLGLFTVGGVFYVAHQVSVDSIVAAWKWLPWVLVPMSLGILLLSFFQKIPRGVFASLVLALAIVDLHAFSIPFRANVIRTSPPTDLTALPRTVLAMDRDGTPYRSIANKQPATDSSARAILYENMALTYGKQGADAYLVGLGLARNDVYIKDMSLAMRDLMNIRYYLLPIEEPPYSDQPAAFDEYEPMGGLTSDLLAKAQPIPPTPAVQLDLISYTDESQTLPDGTLAGEIVLGLANGESEVLPIRLGIETADWAYDGISEMRHGKPQEALTFPAYLKSVGRSFDGHKYVAHYSLATSAGPAIVTSVQVNSLSDDAQLTVERISLVDANGHSASLAALLNRTEMSLVFRSHTAMMWENEDVLPRAFMVHHVEVANDQEVFQRMHQGEFDPSRVVLLSENPKLEPSKAAYGMRGDQVTITSYQPERVILNVSSNQPGILVLTDSSYPGWEATVDGEPAPIYRADYMFKSVPVPAGQHTVIFQYRPASVIWGAVISGLSLLTCCVLVVVAMLGSRSGPKRVVLV